MSIIKNSLFTRDQEFRANLGDYREIKVKGLSGEVHGVRIESGEVWDMDHLITYGLSLDGFVFVRHARILAELNQERYDEVDMLLSFSEKPEEPGTFPGLDDDRALFAWLRDKGKLVMVSLPGQVEAIMGRVEVVADKGFQMRFVSDAMEVAEELFEFEYTSVHMVVTGTHLLRMFDRYLEIAGEG